MNYTEQQIELIHIPQTEIQPPPIEPEVEIIDIVDSLAENFETMETFETVDI